MSGWETVACLNKINSVSCRVKKLEDCCTDVQDDIKNIYNIIGDDFTAYYMGSWVTGQSYIKNQYVSYNDILYVALKDNSSVAPDSSTTDWKAIGTFNTIINGGTF